MLRIITTFEPGLMEKLKNIYRESMKFYFKSEDFFADFCYDTIQNKKCILFLWNHSGEDVSGVFSEMDQERVLLYTLETKPDCRGKGYAKALLSAVLDFFNKKRVECVHTHIVKDNRASLRLHQNLGFQIILDSARLLDGTVSQKYYTLSYKKEPL